MPRRVNLDPIEVADALRWMPLHGASPQQVAELMDCSAQTVRQRINELAGSEYLNAGRINGGNMIIWLNKPKVNQFMETLPDFEYVSTDYEESDNQRKNEP